MTAENAIASTGLEAIAIDNAYEQAVANLFTVFALPDGNERRFRKGLQTLRAAYATAHRIIEEQTD